MTDVAMYIKECPIPEILHWVSHLFGPIKLVFDGDKRFGAKIFHVENVGVIIAISVAEHQYNDGAFTEVTISSDNSTAIPWVTNLEFSKAAFKQFKREIRCDPGEFGKKHNPFEWMCVDSRGERLIDWFEEDDD